MQIGDIERGLSPEVLPAVVPKPALKAAKKTAPKEPTETRRKAHLREFAQVLAAQGCDPAIIAAKFALAKIACHCCQGKGRLRYRRQKGGALVYDPDPKAPRTAGVLACLHCKGSGKEPLEPQVILNAALGLLPYRWPRLKHKESIHANLNLTGSLTVEQLAAFLAGVPEEKNAIDPPPTKQDTGKEG